MQAGRSVAEDHHVALYGRGVHQNHGLLAPQYICPKRGPGRKMADFVTAVIAHESDFDRPDTSRPVCFKCRKSPVDTVMADNQAILWRCSRCSTEGGVLNWQGTFWDFSRGSPSD